MTHYTIPCIFLPKQEIVSRLFFAQSPWPGRQAAKIEPRPIVRTRLNFQQRDLESAERYFIQLKSVRSFRCVVPLAIFCSDRPADQPAASCEKFVVAAVQLLARKPLFAPSLRRSSSVASARCQRYLQHLYSILASRRA